MASNRSRSTKKHLWIGVVWSLGTFKDMNMCYVWRNMRAVVEIRAIFNELAVCICNSVCCVYMWQKMRKRHYCVSVCIVIQLGSAAPKWHKITYCRVDMQCSSTLKSRELNTHNEAISSSFFFPLLRCLFIIYFFYFRGLKMEIKSYIFNCELYFF